MPRARGPDRRANSPRPPPGAPSFAERRQGEDRRSNGYISRLQLFLTIPYDAVEATISGAPLREVAAGEVLLEPGQSNDAIHLLVSGRLRIHFDRADSPDFIPVEEGGCFGELSIIDGRPVSAFVVADRDSRILTVHETVFWERLVRHPGVARNLLRVLSERMRLNGDIILDRMKDRHALELIHKELSIAQDIQMAMLPRGAQLLREHPDVLACAVMEPAKNVGGDLYELFEPVPGRLFFAVGDVSGKGIPAALFMARTVTQLRIEAFRLQHPSDVIDAVNRALCSSNDAGMFVTLFCGVLDTDTGMLSYANAGHNPPLLIDAEGGARLLEGKRGLVAGFAETSCYPENTLQLARGQCLLLYTDGVTEAMNAQGECYSEERLLSAVNGCAADNPRALIDTVRAGVTGFVRGADQADDITLLALSYRHPR